ncbi:MAG TPA: NAD(+)/NADH kinase [Methanocorpusculum sp.]|nr:NAD(+)/NADH kinase [Methanocorpusculum sp.]
MKICIVSRVDIVETIETARSIGWILANKGYDVIYENSIASELGYTGVDISLPSFKSDLIVVVGGDGSILRAVRMLVHQIPIIGINHGSIGFLTDIDRNKAEDVLLNLSLPLNIDQRMRINIEHNGKIIGSALNEAVIVTARPSKMLKFEIYIDGNKSGTFRSDGLIISTPTGSTAYAMSAGGPIVDPQIEAFVLVPLAPFMMSSRAQLIQSQSKIEVKLVSTKPAQLVIDGQIQYDIGTETSLIISKSSDPALFLNVGKYFFSKVDQKLRYI